MTESSLSEFREFRDRMNDIIRRAPGGGRKYRDPAPAAGHGETRGGER
ncbi:MAG TPA: hypothetical protein VJ817_12450 [Gemmatimonadales bacterium]|nr:hypothetical protein [Gemmatimonadales bacterium]